MTQHKVISEDSMTAMDEISKVLGNEAVILSTKKSNGKIEIIGSNDIKDVLKSKKLKTKSFKPSFQDLFTKEPLKKDEKLFEKKIKSEKEILVNTDDKGHILIKKELEHFKTEIQNLFRNMIITDENSISNSYDKSIFLKLIKKGFSKEIINSIFFELEEVQKSKTEVNFYKQLSNKLVFSSREKLKSSSLIFVAGLTGVGKTTLSAKIASFLLDSNTIINKTNNISLINLSSRSANKSSDLINYGRLLNINVHSFFSIDDLEKFILANKNRKLVIDVSKDFFNDQVFNDFLNKNLEEINSLLFLAVQSGINKKSFKQQFSLFKTFRPILALTKLDETLIGTEELSCYAESNGKIGLLSSSKNIIESLAFAQDEILAQYMNEI